LKNKKVLILGYAYLKDSDDDRNSPSKVLAELLTESGSTVVIHDPFISAYTGSVEQKAVGCDAVVLMTAHSAYKELNLPVIKDAMRTPILIDGRNVIDRNAAKNSCFKLVRLGDSSQENS